MGFCIVSILETSRLACVEDDQDGSVVDGLIGGRVEDWPLEKVEIRFFSYSFLKLRNAMQDWNGWREYKSEEYSSSTK